MIEILFLGILQGIFEWLPISSQGNLSLIMVGLMGMTTEYASEMAVFLHTGTLLSVLVYFRKDVWEILKNLKTYRPNYNENNATTSFLIISTLVTGLVGGFLFVTVKGMELPGEIFIGIIGIALIITGFLQKVSKERSIGRKLDFRDSIILGLLQGLSAIPGISRSGITVSGFLFRGYKSEKALRLSFLMSIPAVLGAEIGLGLMNALPAITLMDMFAGVGTAFLVGIVSIHVLLKIAKKVRFWIFCIVVGLIALVPLCIYLFS